jgi:hypothetical protein
MSFPFHGTATETTLQQHRQRLKVPSDSACDTSVVGGRNNLHGGGTMARPTSVTTWLAATLRRVVGSPISRSTLTHNLLLALHQYTYTAQPSLDISLTSVQNHRLASCYCHQDVRGSADIAPPILTWALSFMLRGERDLGTHWTGG